MKIFELSPLSGGVEAAKKIFGQCRKAQLVSSTTTGLFLCLNTNQGSLRGASNLPLLVEVSSIASLFTQAVLRNGLSPCPELNKGARLGWDLTKLPIPIKMVPARAWTLRTSSRRKTPGEWPASGGLVATKRRNSFKGSLVIKHGSSSTR